MMNGHGYPGMPAPGLSVSPNVAALVRQMQPGRRSLLDHPPQFYIPSNVAGFDFDETLRQTNNASNQNVLAVITEETRHSQPPIESGAGQGPAVQDSMGQTNDWLTKNGIRFHTGMFNIDADRKSCRLAFNSERDKKSVEDILAVLRRDSKSKSKGTTWRPDAKTFVGDVRKWYKEIKKLLHT